MLKNELHDRKVLVPSRTRPEQEKVRLATATRHINKLLPVERGFTHGRPPVDVDSSGVDLAVVQHHLHEPHFSTFYGFIKATIHLCMKKGHLKQFSLQHICHVP